MKRPRKSSEVSHEMQTSPQRQKIEISEVDMKLNKTILESSIVMKWIAKNENLDNAEEASVVLAKIATECGNVNQDLKQPDVAEVRLKHDKDLHFALQEAWKNKEFHKIKYIREHVISFILTCWV